MSISKKFISIFLAAIMLVSMLVVAPMSASAADKVRINEVYPQVGQYVLYDVYLQTNQETGKMEGRLNYDHTVLELYGDVEWIQNSVYATTATDGDMTTISFTGQKSLYDTASARVVIFTAVFKVIGTSDKYTSATSADAVSGCFTKLTSTSGNDLMSSAYTNITTRTIIAATSLTMAKSSVVLDRGKGDKETVAVKAVGPVNNDIESSYRCSFKSLNTKVAKVSPSIGTRVVITAVGPGTTYVRCTPDGGLTYRNIKVTVKQPVKSVRLSKTTVKLLKKNKYQNVKATVNPTNASVKKLKVKSANSRIAKVNTSYVNSGKYFRITAVKKGRTYVTVTATDGSKKYARCTVIVSK